MSNKEPKTQGKIVDWKIFIKNLINQNFNPNYDIKLFGKSEIEIKCDLVAEVLIDWIERTRKNQLQRVIELIGEDEPSNVKNFKSSEGSFYGVRNSLRKQLKTKISQMGEELKKSL